MRDSFVQIKQPNKWMDEVERIGHGTQDRSTLTAEERISVG